MDGLIRRIRLKGFMSHSDSEFELAPRLTVLTGPNNCGKSAVVEALQCVCGNSAGGFMVRHGEKEASVLVETSEGDVIEWRRIKGSNSFVVNGGDPIFRTLPDNLHELLRLARVSAKEGEQDFDVHFGEQKRPIFLLGDSGAGRRAATFFASSSDAQYLVQMQSIHKQRTQDARRDASRLTGEIAELENELKAFAPLDDLGTRLSGAEADYRSVVAAEQDELILNTVITDLTGVQRARGEAKSMANAYSSLATPPILHESAELAAWLRSLDAAASEQARLMVLVSALSKVAPPPEVPNLAPIVACVAALRAVTRKAHWAGRRSEASAALTSPPELRPTEPLLLELERRRSAEAAFGQANRLADLLHLVDEPPTVADTAGLSLAVERVTTAANRLSRASRVANALVDLGAPPTVADCDALAAHLGSLGEAAEERGRKARSVEALTTLVPPPDMSDLASLRQAVFDVRGRQEDVGLACDKLRVKESSLSAVADAIRLWAETNERCPTCGSPVSADSIFDHLEVAVA